MSLPHNINVQARVSTLIDFKLLSVELNDIKVCINNFQFR